MELVVIVFQPFMICSSSVSSFDVIIYCEFVCFVSG